MPGNAAVVRGSPIDVHSLQPPSKERWKIVLSVPRANTSRRPELRDETAGPKFSAPPSDSQPLQPPSLNHLCQRARSVPRTNTSILPLPQETAAGGEVRLPPSACQSLHLPLSNHLCQRAKSSPRPRTSSLPGPHEHMAGGGGETPPRDTPSEKEGGEPPERARGGAKPTG